MSNEKDYFIESVSMMVGSGMDILASIRAVETETRSRRFKKIIGRLWNTVNEGTVFSEALARQHIASPHVISLIAIGERSGRLAENLAMVAVASERDRVFKSKLRSAMMYPLFVLMLSVIVGAGIAWFILPRLATVFVSLHAELPVITRLLITAGTFLQAYGSIAIPLFIVAMVAFFYFIFRFSKTRFIGQKLLLLLPGIKTLLQEIEIARMGYLLGTLLEAGLPVVEAARSLAEATTFVSYRALYLTMARMLEEGNSFEKSFKILRGARRFIPVPVQQMIVAGEQSGRLAEVLRNVGTRYESRTDTTTKNLSVILEPIMLVIVWVGVMFVALAVILPIYSLIGSIR
ncbi:MAG: type II secretion system F family protein [Candidatus Magasanikbacteria bacterium]|nr:type II secretion system F family protein [Candidatus Magasanikbacteria bacterium]